jgi:aspartate/methionine/tyrosine aminotransferase
MELLLNGPNQKPAGFMIPIPQYPLYTATISEYGAEKVRKRHILIFIYR